MNKHLVLCGGRGWRAVRYVQNHARRTQVKLQGPAGHMGSKTRELYPLFQFVVQRGYASAGTGFPQIRPVQQPSKNGRVMLVSGELAQGAQATQGSELR